MRAAPAGAPIAGGAWLELLEDQELRQRAGRRCARACCLLLLLLLKAWIQV
jgi:hypothetical protein